MSKEIELRAEVNPSDLKKIERQFSDLSVTSTDERLSVIFLGSVNDKNVDIRIRINSGKYAELVLKIGDFHSHDRTELVQKINPEEFMGLVKIFSKFGFGTKVMRRKTKRLVSEQDNYELALVDAQKIAYVELEKVIDTEDEKVITQEKDNLENILANAGMKAINKEQFDNLCDRLTADVDWKFSGTPEDYSKLEAELADFL